MNIPELLVELDSLPPDGLDIDLNLAPEAVTALATADGQPAPTVTSPLTGALNLSRSGQRLFLKGSFETEVQIACDRCLAEARTPLAGKVDETLDLIFPDQPRSSADDEEIDGLEVMDGRVDLARLMAEFFWLAWPYRFICSEDCAGLCVRCGANLNQGPCGCGEPDWN